MAKPTSSACAGGQRGLLVNYGWCSGCHSCEVACQMENGLPTDQFGIKINVVGPWQYGKKNWVFENIPVLTDQCDFCAERLAAGKKPMCEQHCQAKCIKFVDAADAATEMAGKSKVMFLVK